MDIIFVPTFEPQMGNVLELVVADSPTYFSFLDYAFFVEKYRKWRHFRISAKFHLDSHWAIVE